MKAVVIHGPSKMSVDDIPIEEPGPGEVLIKVKAAGICGTDYELYTNEMVYIQTGMADLPIVPGHEWSGVIEKLGPGVKSFAPGDKVSGECTVSCGHCRYCRNGLVNMCEERTETGIMNRKGGFAEYITFPVSHLHKFTKLSFEEASLIEPTGIALYAVMRGRVTPADNVLVTGPGPVGLQAAQIAKNVYNAKRVILSGTRDERLERASGFGLDGVINIKKEDLVSRVREITKGEMIDVVIEESGGAGVFGDIAGIINSRGRIVLNGFFGEKKAPIDWDAFTVKEIEFLGALGSPNIWDEVISLLESGKINTKVLISHRIALKDFVKGLDLMVERKDNACKIIVEP